MNIEFMFNDIKDIKLIYSKEKKLIKILAIILMKLII